MNSIFTEAAELCRAGTPFVWASIISQDGSTPRSAGSRMLVLDSSIVSTIGGGGMEAGVIAMARTSVLKDRKPRIMHYDMSGGEAATAGLICGGVCEVLLAYMEPEYASIMEAAAQAEIDGAPAWLFYILDEKEGSDLPFQLCLNVGGERLVGSFRATRTLCGRCSSIPSVSPFMETWPMGCASLPRMWAPLPECTSSARATFPARWRRSP